MKYLALPMIALLCLLVVSGTAEASIDQLQKKADNEAHALLLRQQDMWISQAVGPLHADVPAWWDSVPLDSRPLGPKTVRTISQSGGAESVLLFKPRKDPLKLDEWNNALLAITTQEVTEQWTSETLRGAFGTANIWIDVGAVFSSRSAEKESSAVLLGATALRLSMNVDIKGATYFAQRAVVQSQKRVLLVSLIAPLEMKDKATGIFDHVLASIGEGAPARTVFPKSSSSSSKSSTQPLKRNSLVPVRKQSIRKASRTKIRNETHGYNPSSASR